MDTDVNMAPPIAETRRCHRDTSTGDKRCVEYTGVDGDGDRDGDDDGDGGGDGEKFREGQGDGDCDGFGIMAIYCNDDNQHF